MAVRGFLLPLLVLVALAAGCHGGQHARADTVDAGLDRPFVLAGGQQAEIAGEPLRLRFTEVPEDPRCPTRIPAPPRTSRPSRITGRRCWCAGPVDASAGRGQCRGEPGEFVGGDVDVR
ncbi:hypothetical protein [Mycobacterium neumannii]|uniref:hypothetical protein n=1 Tax=Mycobacterium neumannii TaxID=2048551 RepID=UPI003AB7ED17